MNNLIIGVLGKIHAGKSTLAKELSERFNIPIVSFGRYLREYSIANGLSADRASLQDLGNRRIMEDSEKFLNDVLEQSGVKSSVVIIEGIRHIVVMESLTKLFKDSYFIYCDTPFEERHRRYAVTNSCMEMTRAEFRNIDNHDVEKEIELMKVRCNALFEEDQREAVYNTLEEYIRNVSAR